MNGFDTNYDTLKDTGNYLTTKSKELDALYGDLKLLYDEISKNWSGDDYDTYISKAYEVLKKNQDQSKNVGILGDVLTYAANNYSTSAYEFEKNAKGEIVNG